MSIILGPIKPWTLAAYKEIQALYPCSSVYGNPSTGKPDHLAGLALDFMVMTDKGKGESISQYAIANAARLDIGYVIWYQRIWYPSNGWTPMADRGSINANHMNHVHVNFKATGPSGNAGPAVVPAGATATNVGLPNPIDALSGLNNAVTWITDMKNLARIAMFLLGAAMIGITIGRAMGASQTIKSTVKAASSVSRS